MKFPKILYHPSSHHLQKGEVGDLSWLEMVPFIITTKMDGTNVGMSSKKLQPRRLALENHPCKK